MTACRRSVLLLCVLAAPVAGHAACAPTLDHNFRRLSEEVSDRLCDRFQNQVLLVVNTASFCGFTPQFEGLRSLHQRYGNRGFAVVGFPSNDFRQDPASEGDIRDFCDQTYKVDFPMYQKTRVNAGPDTHPFFRGLAAAAGGLPEWNFYKYLIGRDGRVLGRFSSLTSPDDAELLRRIEAALQGSS